MVKKLEVEFQSDINNKSLIDRKYTLTHCDTTGQRYLLIGTNFDETRYNKLRDEVVGEWVKVDDSWELRIMCTLYSEYSFLTIKERYQKFKEHMPRAITAIINGDMEYILENNLLDCNVYVYFLSDLISDREYYGKVVDYKKP